ncbi:MAG: HlyD family secretion protein, partial [Verrucomicrobia bacterium]|nr:HlyD family secretion protein [Verrucomicrobiota bacterium]
NLQSAQKKVTADQASVIEAQARVNTIIALLQSVAAQVQESDANLETARLNQSYTVINAPENGRISHKSVEPGDYVQAGQTLTALVPENIWVTANFKEDQISLMRPGQPAKIKIDALHGRTFRAHVDSIQAGSGARFSLLPPENATGNYVKVVQRVPVKIVFDEQPESGLPLGPGESVVPRVQVQEFNYSWLDLTVYAGMVVVVVGLILWLGLRPSRKD